MVSCLQMELCHLKCYFNQRGFTTNTTSTGAAVVLKKTIKMSYKTTLPTVLLTIITESVPQNTGAMMPSDK